MKLQPYNGGSQPDLTLVNKSCAYMGSSRNTLLKRTEIEGSPPQSYNLSGSLTVQRMPIIMQEAMDYGMLIT
jgi:hypothetical protein